jgi:hypothetical protein
VERKVDPGDTSPERRSEGARLRARSAYCCAVPTARHSVRRQVPVLGRTRSCTARLESLVRSKAPLAQWCPLHRPEQIGSAMRIVAPGPAAASDRATERQSAHAGDASPAPVGLRCVGVRSRNRQQWCRRVRSRAGRRVGFRRRRSPHGVVIQRQDRAGGKSDGRQREARRPDMSFVAGLGRGCRHEMAGVARRAGLGRIADVAVSRNLLRVILEAFAGRVRQDTATRNATHRHR